MADTCEHPLTFRWNALFRGKQVSEAADFGIDLIRRWQEPQRVYHTIEHLETCLNLLDAHQARASDRRMVEMALWYHDAVYDPRSSDNEAKSAELAVNDLEWLGEDQSWSKRVATAILATATHRTDNDPDISLVLDIDLAILASKPAIYDQFELNIRHEYRHIPWMIFCQGRSQLLKGFLARKHLFHCGFLDESVARGNLTRAIHVLLSAPEEANFGEQLAIQR